MTRRADVSHHLRWGVGLMAMCLVLSGGTCDAALDHPEQFVFTIYVPKREQPQEARFGPVDTEALGLESSVVSSTVGPTYDGFIVATSIVTPGGRGVEYCFVEPVMLVDGSTESVLVEPGECLSSGQRSIDRTGDDARTP